MSFALNSQLPFKEIKRRGRRYHFTVSPSFTIFSILVNSCSGISSLEHEELYLAFIAERVYFKTLF